MNSKSEEIVRFYYDADQDDLDYVMPRAFAVDDGEPDEGPPTSGLDYLKRVRWETKQTPGIVVANINPRKYDTNQTRFMKLSTQCPKPSAEFLPNSEWQIRFMHDFEVSRKHFENLYQQNKSQARVTLTNIPQIHETRKWNAFCFGIQQQTPKKHGKTTDQQQQQQNNNNTSTITTTTVTDMEEDKQEETTNSPILAPTLSFLTQSEEKESAVVESEDAPITTTSVSQGHSPSFSVLFQLDEVSISKLLTEHIRWLERMPFTSLRGEWLYALLLRLDKPIDADMAYSLRRLLKRLCTFRVAMTDPKSELLASINILITIITIYFGQLEY